MKKKNVFLSFSGGMDSTVLLYHALDQYDIVHTATFNYGQRHLREIDCAKYHVEANKLRTTNIIIDLPFVKCFGSSALINKDIAIPQAKNVMGDPQTKSYIPNRNMIFLSILTALAEDVGCDTVMYGAAQADSVAGYWDGSDEFLTAINSVNILNRRNKIKIEAPLIEMSKSEIITWGKKLKVPFDKTWTCYEGKEVACGTCTACSLRLQGFINAGIQDPLSYEKDIPWDVLLSR